MGTEGDSTWGGEHTMQYPDDDVLWGCTLETYIILLTDVASINLKKNLKKGSVYIHFLEFQKGIAW